MVVQAPARSARFPSRSPSASRRFRPLVRPASAAAAKGRWSRRLPCRRRPAIGLGAGAAHQHGPLAVAQAIGHTEGFDGLLLVDDGHPPRPVPPPPPPPHTP